MSSPGTRVSPQRAIEVAGRALKEMVPDAEQPRLEEITLSDDDNRWLVTFSFFSASAAEHYDPLAELLKVTPAKRRQVRMFEIDANSGLFRGMKLRRDV
jgi:hypothetical protein